MPELDCFDWLIRTLFDVGPATQGPSGATAIGYADIAAYAAVTGVELSGTEAQMLRRLSRAYVGQLAQSRNPACPPPYVRPVATAEQRRSVDQGFRLLAARRKKR